MQNPPAKGPTVQKPCTDRADPAFGRVHKKEKAPNLTIQRLIFGALVGTRIPGPLIKSANQALLVHVAACNLLSAFVEIPRIF